MTAKAAVCKYLHMYLISLYFTYTHKNTPVGLLVSSPTIYSDIVQANCRLHFFVAAFCFSVWVCWGWIIVYVAACFYPKPHPVSVWNCTLHFMFSSICLQHSEMWCDLHSYIVLIFYSSPRLSCNVHFANWKHLCVYIDLNVVCLFFFQMKHSLRYSEIPLAHSHTNCIFFSRVCLSLLACENTLSMLWHH